MIEKYLVKKITEPVDWKVTVPGSKSMTNRALKNDSFVNVRQELKVFKRKYIETDDYDEEKIEKIFIQ